MVGCMSDNKDDLFPEWALSKIIKGIESYSKEKLIDVVREEGTTPEAVFDLLTEEELRAFVKGCILSNFFQKWGGLFKQK